MHISSIRRSFLQGRVIFTVCCVGVLLLTITLRANSVMTPYERDEGEYAYSARLLLRGRVPYAESFLQKPPLIVYTYAIGQLLDSEGVWPPRVLAILCVWGIAIATGYIASRVYGSWAGYAVMWLVPPMLSSPYLAALAANTEIFMLLPLTVCIALLYRHDSHTSGKVCFLSGVCAMTAVLYKPIALFPLGVMYVVWLVRMVRSETSSRHGVIRSVLGAGAGSCVALVLSVGYIVLRGGGREMYESVIGFNQYYIGSFGWGWDFLSYRLSQLFTQWTILFPLALWGIVHAWRRSLPLLLMIVASLPALAQTPIGHYYLLVMPMWATLCAGAIISIARLIDTRSHAIITTVITVLVVGYLLAVVGEQFGKSPYEMGVWIYGTGNPFAESRLVADKVREFSRPDDRIFVAGSEPQILYYADRLSATRFVITYPFVIRTPLQQVYQREAMSDIQHMRPRVIVLSRRPESGFWSEDSPTDMRDFLIRYIRDDYALRGAVVVGSDTMMWSERPTQRELDRSSLLVYVRE